VLSERDPFCPCNDKSLGTILTSEELMHDEQNQKQSGKHKKKEKRKREREGEE